MRLQVAYERPDELLADDEAQFQRGGVLVRVEPPAGLQLFETVELAIVTAFAGTVTVSGQVVQLIPGTGVAVTFDPTEIRSLLDAARGDKPKAAARPGPANDIAARIHAALYGNKDERMRIMRDVNRMLHPYVLRNAGLGVDEVLSIAKMTTMAQDLLGSIADRRDWAQRPEIAIALIRNPKTPTAAAIRLLDFVTTQDLRQLAKDTHTRPAVQQAARKKVIG